MLITYEIDYVKNNSNNPILCILKSWKLDWYTRALTKRYDLRDSNKFSMHTVTAGRTRTRTRKLFYKDCSLGSVKNVSNN